MMKTLQILFAAGVMLWLAIASFIPASRHFINDVIELYGSNIFGLLVSVNESSVSWERRQLLVSDLCVSSEKNYSWAGLPLICSKSVLLSAPQEFSLDWKQPGILPEVTDLDALEIGGLSVFYDIDTEGENLRTMRMHLSSLSSIALRDRLNFKAQGVSPSLLFKIRTVRVSDIKIDARSHDNSPQSRVFAIENLVLSDVGVTEGGIAVAEVLDRVSRGVVDRVQIEAVRQGLVEVERSAVEGKPSRKRTSTKDTEPSDAGNDGGLGNAARSIGHGFKKAGADIWQGAKNFFD